ncbi:hypothetical protein NQ315_006124 [Exocentrus adspersus]|uniref:DUF7869 domain-containing protein n=1 Tax=Exocentrus adspersus TaxID=1586481 RepID=A0AAV8VD07_9CUCU|nr:hypothetical protein NQ315_006124 [Exocentrus adspersus]
MSTLNIGDTMIRTAMRKSNDKKIVSPDLRGKHGNHKKLDPALKAGVKKHIESLPTVESHYLRQQTERTYIEGDLTLATLYRDYKRECEESGKPFVKACIYEQIFNFEYNIGWHRPKKDQCSTCERYANSSTVEKAERQSEYEKHVADKTKSREEKQRDVSIALQDPTRVVAVYDLQSVLSTPCSEVSDFYYKSKLATYNFTIFNIANKEGSCYVWSENTAKRGANEIGSCVLQFLTSNCKEKHVTFYSDNCAGQNKNKYIASLYLYATTFLEIQSITHKYLVTGHTQNEGDSMHSCIEKEKKRLLKGGPIFIPAQWVPVIQGAKKKGKPYHVKEMDQSEFFDLQKLSNDIGTNFITDVEKKKVKWTEIKIMMVTKDEPDSLFFKYDYGDDIPYSKIQVRNNNVSLRSNKRKTRNENKQFSGKLCPAYSEELKISKQKKMVL